MLKTRVTLGNIYRILLDLIRGLTFVTLKDFPHQCSCFLFSYPITAASRLNFGSLALSVWPVS